MRIRLAITLAFLLMVSACGGGTGSTSTTATTVATTTTTAPTTTTTQPGFEVTSEDGDLTVEVPFEAMAADPGITIRLLDGDEYPPELAAAADNPNSRIYELEPDGTVFAAPVTVTRRIDASRFGDALGPDEVPIVILVTYNADGTYEPYGDQRVVRSGGDVFVSGTTTHFSPAIAISLEAKVKLGLDDYHLGYGTELGTSLDIGFTYSTMTGMELAAPAMTRPVGYTRSMLTSFFDIPGDTPNTGRLGVMCDKIGEAPTQLGVSMTLEAEPGEGVLGLTGAVLGLMGFLEDLEVSLNIAGFFGCFDPETALIGLALGGFQIASDHPGGTAWVPNGDFLGGASAAYLWMNDVPRLEGVWGGLIQDTNGNRMIDPTDTMFQPYPFSEVGEMYAYVAPLFNYGSYFVYLVDGNQYADGPPLGTSWTLGTGLTAWSACYTGSGRVETSIGYVGAGGAPFVYEVGPSEEAVTPVAPIIYQFLGVVFEF